MATTNYPDDADGDALRRVAEGGADMFQPMLVDFMVAAESRTSADSISSAAAALGYATQIERDDERDSWTVYCSRTMLLDYGSVIAAQAELDKISKPYGGHSDGWGTFGNTVDANGSSDAS